MKNIKPNTHFRIYLLMFILQLKANFCLFKIQLTLTELVSLFHVAHVPLCPHGPGLNRPCLHRPCCPHRSSSSLAFSPSSLLPISLFVLMILVSLVRVDHVPHCPGDGPTFSLQSRPLLVITVWIQVPSSLLGPGKFLSLQCRS